jgi:hypothetical protein
MVGRVWVTSSNDSQYGGKEKGLRDVLTSGRASLRARSVSIHWPQAVYISRLLSVTLGQIFSRSGGGGGLGRGGPPFVFFARLAISAVDIGRFILAVREVSVSLEVSGLCNCCPVEELYKYGRSLSFILSKSRDSGYLHCPQ